MVDFVSYGLGDARALDLYDFARVPSVFFDQSPTSFKVAYGSGNITVFQGYGFNYDPNTGAPIAGTTTYGLRYVNGEPYGLITGISITSEQAAAYIFMNDPQAVNQDVFKGDDRITGSNFDDFIDGWAGADRLAGGAGNDTYILDNSGDRVIEAVNGGYDKVLSSVSHALLAGQEVEALQLLSSTGRAKLNLTGNEFGQSLVGNNGANVLDGGGGADSMNGRGGNDTYIVDNAGDRVIEAVGGGNDKVLCSVSYTLEAGQEIEALQLLSTTGRAALDLTGNEFGQTLVGNNGANTLNGGLGNDVLIGRGGADTFVFASALGGSNVDRISDFSGDDTIELSATIFTALSAGELSTDAFKDVGAGGTLDESDRIIYDSSTGALSYDADGLGAGAAVQFATLDNRAALSASDFLIA